MEDITNRLEEWGIDPDTITNEDVGQILYKLDMDYDEKVGVCLQDVKNATIDYMKNKKSQ